MKSTYQPFGEIDGQDPNQSGTVNQGSNLTASKFQVNQGEPTFFNSNTQINFRIEKSPLPLVEEKGCDFLHQ